MLKAKLQCSLIVEMGFCIGKGILKGEYAFSCGHGRELKTLGAIENQIITKIYESGEHH